MVKSRFTTNGTFAALASVATLLSAGVVPPAAHATLLAYDGFDYTAGATVGPPKDSTLTGGYGWSGGWGSYNGGAQSTVQATGLTYGTLATTGLSLTLTNGAARSVSQTVANDFNYNGNVVGTLWMSILAEPNNGGASGNFGLVSLGQSGTSNTNPDFYNGTVGFGDYGGYYSLWTNGYGSPQQTSVAASDGTTALLVLEFAFNNAATTETLYVDPTPGLSAPNAGAAAVTKNFGLEFNGAVNLGASSAWTADELRFGTTYADVSPAIPEPATLGLLALGGLGMLLLPRKRRAVQGPSVGLGIGPAGGGCK